MIYLLNSENKVILNIKSGPNHAMNFGPLLMME